jgi:8-oxo-dGTP diphosphatase
MDRPRHPLPTVDVIIEVEKGIVLIERKNPPLGWALPGGFVDAGETLEAAAAREAREETSLDVEILELFHAYSDPARDPRGPTISVVFLARARGTPVGADDARRAIVADPEAPPQPLCFDHAQILSDFCVYRRTGRRPPIRLGGTR